MAGALVAYRYGAPSACGVVDGRAEVSLATSGGAVEHPYFFDGPVANPRPAAQGILTVAAVARTRFETGPTPTQRAAILDPILTAGDSMLRVESFSMCCGVYARLDLDEGVLEDAFCGAGTTNIDLNPPMRMALGVVGDRNPMSLSVGAEQVAMSAAGATVIERKVPLPDRWVRGLGEVQVDLAGMVLRHELAAPAARAFLQSLPTKASAAALWAVPAGPGLRLASRGGGSAVSLAGTHRLRLAADLASMVRGLRVYAPPPADRAGAGSAAHQAPVTSSGWEVLLDGARLWFVLSPGVYRGFSGEGGMLFALALGRPGAGDAAAGRTGFDPGQGRWFARTLPFDRAAVERASPRLLSALELVAEGAATESAGRWSVRSEGAVHRVVLDGPVATCTCPWFAKHRGERGPCKHVLAAVVVDAGRSIEGMSWPVPT